MSSSDDGGDSAFDAEDDKITKLKSALWLPLGQLVDRTVVSLGKNATPQFIGSLTELVWHQIETAAVDVESFARHAGRTTVTTEDVLLLTRWNEVLADLLKGHLSKTRAANGNNHKKQKK